MSGDVNAIIDNYDDWRGQMLSTIRRVVKNADLEVVEEAKWRKATNPLGVATWSHDGLLCSGEVYKDKVKVTFFKGASLEDMHGLFNAPKSGTRAAIDLREGDTLNEPAFTELLHQAIALNVAA